MSETMKANLIIPEVIADLVETNLGSRLTLLPVTTQDNTLLGQPGDTIKFPAFRYIGKADVINENGEITPALLTADTVSATVMKYAKAVTVTDEARLSGFGDPVGEAAKQLAHSIDHALDDALFEKLGGVAYHRVYPIAALTSDAVADALTLFSEELEGDKILLVNPAGFAALRKDEDYIRASDLGQRMIFSGVVGEIWGCQIVVSDKIAPDATLKETRYYIIKPGALRLINKSGTFVEVERDARHMRDSVYASKHCAAYLYDDSRLIALSQFTGAQDISATGGITTVAGGSGQTKLLIPGAYAPAPNGMKWVYKMDTSATITLTFGTAVTGATDWAGSGAAITASTNTFIHAILVNAADNKPVKVANAAIVKGA